MDIERLSEKIIWVSILWAGRVFAYPIIILNELFRIPKIKVMDIFDIWTFSHVFSTYLIADMLYSWFRLSVESSFILSFVIMYLYEFLLDGFHVLDDGFSVSDIGADFWGALFWLLVHVI